MFLLTKIASFENNHLPLIRRVAATGKPLIISTGLASLADLEQAVTTAREAGCRDLVLLKCTSTYPATPENTNIRTLPHLRELFGCEVGLSDHTMGVGVSVAAVALGATVIEKHFTLARADGGVDSVFSLEPTEMTLVQETQRAWQALGEVRYGPTKAEIASLQFRRSIYVAAEIAMGEPFTPQNIKVVRPGNGAPPYLYDQLLGRPARRAFKPGTPLNLDHPLITPRLRLRPFHAADISASYLSWLNDPEVTRFSNQRFKQHTAESSAAYLESFAGNGNSFLLIEQLMDLRPIGTVTVYRDNRHLTADIGLMVGDRQCWGQGYGRESWQWMLEYLLVEERTRKVTGGTVRTNRAIRSWKNQECTLKQFVLDSS